MILRRIALHSILALAVLIGAGPAAAQTTTIARLSLPEQPQRSSDPEQETLALQMAETLGLACRGPEMWRWQFKEDDFPHAQAIVNAGERAFRDRGYAVTLLPVEVDIVTAMQAHAAPGAAAADANVLALWYVGELGVDLTLCRLR